MAVTLGGSVGTLVDPNAYNDAQYYDPNSGYIVNQDGSAATATGTWNPNGPGMGDVSAGLTLDQYNTFVNGAQTTNNSSTTDPYARFGGQSAYNNLHQLNVSQYVSL